MPSTIEIQKESAPKGGPLDVLRRYMRKFENMRHRNLIVYYSGFLFLPGRVSILDEDMDGFMAAIYKMDKKMGLDLFIHTPGGSVAATEGIGNYLKSVFNDNLQCFVPHMAMSCGTLLAMATKLIFMGKQSCLGPIDPALGNYRADAVIEEFEKAKADIISNPNLSLLWQHIISKYDPTYIGECEKARELAKDVAKEWLLSNMLLKDSNAKNKITSILQLFSEHRESKTHDRHIPASVAVNKGLKIKLIEKDPNLQDAVMSVHHAAINYMKVTGNCKIVSNVSGKGLFVRSPT